MNEAVAGVIGAFLAAAVFAAGVFCGIVGTSIYCDGPLSTRRSLREWWSD